MTHVYAFDDPLDAPLADVASLIGGKAANLSVMTGKLGLPVPPGFAISTEACRTYLAGGWPDGLDDEIRAHVARVEEAVGRRFGDSSDPLLVSVRSGAPVSMPGMMDTILNLGLNDATAAGLASVTGDPVFVEACQTRLGSMYRDIVGVADVPDDPWEQLRGAIEAVFRSWNSDRARSYRSREGIPDDLGTGVIVQTMVFGNRGPDSATGVLFTRNPATGEAELYGDILFDAQGEDVVAGTHSTEPIAVLDERMPTIAAELRSYAATLERHYADVCDIEFTIEQGKLWMLQTRIGKRSPQAALRIALEMAEDPDFPLDRDEAVRRVADHLVNPPTSAPERDTTVAAIASGLGASPGLVSGQIAVTPDGAVEMADAGARVILVRRETSPDDVHGMAKAVGILTSTGGLASHAAVVARGWGIPAVVGASAVVVADGGVSIGGARFAVGDVLTIDGGTGEVFLGAVAGEATVVPEAATLLAWAEELGIPIGTGDLVGSAVDEPGDGEMVTPEIIVRTLFVKGFGTGEELAPILFSHPEEIGEILDGLAADGLAALAGGMYQLSDAGRERGAQLFEEDRARMGPARAEEALDALLPLDHRIKEIVTAWQMREIDGTQQLNDHTDEEYDGAVLADFAALHEDAFTWLTSLTDALPRLSNYVARLERAAMHAEEGDHMYLASPRVDSYHSVWFELHEDLILLAGRTREDEAAAGRA